MATDLVMPRRTEAGIDLLERETKARVRGRLIPLLFLCYYAAYLDRVNVGFAALEMNKALGFSARCSVSAAAFSSSATSFSRYPAI